MDLASDATVKSPYPSVLLFTNAEGNVVFADQNYLHVSGESAGVLNGEPLHRALPLDPHTTQQLVEMVRRSGHVDGMPIPVRTASGALWLSSCVAVAAHDEYDDFIGVDLVLRQTSFPTGDKRSRLLTHADVLRTYAEILVNEGSLHESRTFIQSYLAAQIGTLQIMLARIAGPAARITLERIANQTAERHALPLSIYNGHLIFFKKDIGLQGYRTFLDTAIRYAVDVLSVRVLDHHPHCDRYDYQRGLRKDRQSSLSHRRSDGRLFERHAGDGFAGGALFRSWGLIALGFLCAASSDLLYALALWQGAYQVNPADGVNFVSFGINLLYVAFYVLVALGLYQQTKALNAR